MSDNLVERLRAIDQFSVEDCFVQSALYEKAADRIEELEAALATAHDLDAISVDTVNRITADLAEMTRRRDEWRKKAEGYDAVRLALRQKVGTPWPPHMSRLLWAGIAADEKKRADDAEAALARALAQQEGAKR